MTGRAEQHPVVVVGAGPAGLAAAITLASYGVRTLVVDRRSRTSTLPRATVATTGTMELLRRWGLEDAAWERSIDVDWRAWACATLAEADAGEAVEVVLPTQEQAALVSPTAPACLAQDELEPLLERRLLSFASARVERGVELVALDAADDGQLVTLAGPSGRRQVRAAYVIGADGARSTVREALGVATDGSEGLAERLAILFRAPLWELVGEHRHGIYFLPGERSFIPAGQPDRWIFSTSWGGPSDLDGLDHAQAVRWIRDAAGSPELSVEVERFLAVSFGVGLAERFRSGSAFLVGDAAHRVTPRGGTGLNMAIRDGFDLGWKLAWVLRGWAGDRLLDSYERERRVVAEFNTRRSTRADGSILETRAGVDADIGGRIAHVWVERDGGLVSTLDLLGEGLTLFVGPGWRGRAPRTPEAAPVAVERLDAIAARALGLSATGALLARPDGHPVALWNEKPPQSGYSSFRQARGSAGCSFGVRSRRNE